MPSRLTSTQRRLASLLTPSTLSLLDAQGYLVIDHAFPTRIAHTLRNEILTCYDAGVMSSNHTAYVEAAAQPRSPTSPSSPSPATFPQITRLYSKPHIYEAEVLPSLLSHPSLPFPLPLLSSFTSSLIPFLDAHLSPLLPHLLLYPGHSSLKLQLNTGHGSFPFHYDSPGGRKDTRRLTLLLYLNPQYVREHGGELVLQPMMGRRVEVEPAWNRVVMFRSDRVLHRVMAARGVRRCCATVWLHGRGRDEEGGREEGEGERDRGEEGVGGWVRRVDVQRALSKCVYEDEWRDSYREAHGDQGGQQLADSLGEDVRRMMRDEGVSRVVELMKGIKREHDAQPARRIGQGQGDVQGGPDEAEEGEEEEDGEGGGEKEVVVRDVHPDELGFLDFL